MLQQYVIDLIAAGKTQDEVISEIGSYYHALTSQADQEILQLQDAIEHEKGRFREQ